jgi:hypothetical protein
MEVESFKLRFGSKLILLEVSLKSDSSPVRKLFQLSRDRVLSGIAALIQKILFVRRHNAAENCVAMGKAPEAPHDVAVAFSIHGIRRPQRVAQGRRPFLVRNVFGMGKGKIKEFAQIGR